jgi:hypothetical protein
MITQAPKIVVSSHDPDFTDEREKWCNLKILHSGDVLGINFVMYITLPF